MVWSNRELIPVGFDRTVIMGVKKGTAAMDDDEGECFVKFLDYRWHAAARPVLLLSERSQRHQKYSRCLPL